MCAPVYTAADIVADPHFRERGLLVEQADEVHGEMRRPGVVPKLTGTPGGIRHGARWTVGADNDDGARRAGPGRTSARSMSSEGKA